MDYDKDRVDDYTLALLLLVSHNREEGYGELEHGKDLIGKR